MSKKFNENWKKTFKSVEKIFREVRSEIFNTNDSSDDEDTALHEVLAQSQIEAEEAAKKTQKPVINTQFNYYIDNEEEIQQVLLCSQEEAAKKTQKPVINTQFNYYIDNEEEIQQVLLRSQEEVAKNQTTNENNLYYNDDLKVIQPSTNTSEETQLKYTTKQSLNDEFDKNFVLPSCFDLSKPYKPTDLIGVNTNNDNHSNDADDSNNC